MLAFKAMCYKDQQVCLPPS